MKLYIVHSIGPEAGECYAFTSRKEAIRKRAQLAKEVSADQKEHHERGFGSFNGRESVSEVEVEEFSISAKGLCRAFMSGSQRVYK